MRATGLFLLSLTILSCFSSAQVITQNFGTGVNGFSIDFVQIGNPNNSADTLGGPNPAGSVSYTFNLGKYEITREMIDKVNAASGLGLTLANLASYGANGALRPATGIT